MAGTVVSNLTDISLCESPFTGWTNLGTGAQGINDPTVFDAIQGANCYQDYKAAGRNSGAQWDFGAGGVDFTGKILIIWLAFSKKNYGANPMRFRLTDTSGNWSEWNMFSQGDLPHGGWLPWALNPSVTRDTGSGTLVLTAIRYVDWRCDTVASKVYVYWDAVRYGYGLDIKAGTSGDPAKLDDFITAEATYAYGIVEKYNNIYFLQGIIRIGSTTGGDATYFKDTNQVIQFKSIKGNPTGFYEIKGQGNGTAETKIFFGTKSGSAGISGCVIRAGTEKFKVTMSDTNITEFGFYGCIFQNADTITGQAYSTVKEFLSSNFVACAEMLPDTGIVKSCIFISSPSSAIRMSSISHHITDCTFISCVRGIHISVIGPFSYNNLDFSGCTYDGYNNCGSSVTVNYDQYSSSTNGWNYDPAGNVIVYATSVTLTVRHVKTGSEPTEYVRCAIYKKSDMTLLMNEDADQTDEQNPTYYKATESCSVTGIVVIIRAREKGYLPFEVEMTIPSGGLDVTAVWIPDPNYTP